MTSIQGSLGLLLGGVGGEMPKKATTLIEVAHRNSDRLVRLINDILDIQKMESGKIDFDVRPHDIVALVRESIDANQAYARTFGASIALAVAPAGAQAMVDSDRFAQVMANLLSNASKFSPRDATVDVSITRADGRIRVAVADHGPGIPDEFRDKLFEKFTQADASDDRVAAGTGLGLSIAKAIIERHGGTAGEVRSQGWSGRNTRKSGHSLVADRSAIANRIPRTRRSGSRHRHRAAIVSYDPRPLYPRKRS